jgi:hypothetical protein
MGSSGDISHLPELILDIYLNKFIKVNVED